MTVIAVMLSMSAFPRSAAAANESAALDQCANDPSPSSHTDGCDAAAADWVNGNVGASKSVYVEGDSLPYRLLFDNLTVAQSNTVTIEWDTTKGSKHALDYLTTFDRTVATANPCLGVAGCVFPGAAGTDYTEFAIPTDPQVTAGGVTPIPGVFTMYGGTITAISAYSGGVSSFVGDNSRTLTLTFTADQPNPVLSWAGHISTRADWGNDNSAVGVSGSPYHTRLIELNGAGGNQDRSLSADAVIFPGSITIVKQATPEGPTSFSFTGTPSPVTAFSLVDDGTATNTRTFAGIMAFTTYTVNETPIPTNWGFDSVSCQVSAANGGSYTSSTTTVNIDMKEGEDWTCSYLDSLRVGGLTVIKNVVNDNGGSTTASAFTLHVTSGGNDVTGSPAAGSESGTTYTLPAGPYVVSENSPPSGYAQTSMTGDCDASGNVTVVVGQTKTCTITNDDRAAHLTLVKTVTNDNGGTAVATDFTLSAAGPTPLSGAGGAASDVNAGSYTLSETTVAGYTAGSWSCVGGTQSGASIALALGQSATCTITNDDQTAHLTLVKTVTNDNGGTAVATDFTLSAAGPTPLSGAGGAASDVNAGSYTLSETTVAGYTASSWSCVGGTQSGASIALALGQSATCTINNNDIQPRLTLVKTVINDNGGTKVVADFPLFAGSTAMTSGQSKGLNAGSFTASETTQYGYTASAWGGDCAANGAVTLSVGDDKTCTITNDDQPGRIVVIKNAKPANGSFAFTTTGAGYNGFSLTGSALNNGNRNSQTLNAGTYTVREGTQLGWILTGIGGSTDTATPYNCVVTGTGGSSGVGNLTTQTASITLNIGDTVTCTFENTGQGVTRTQGFWATHPELAQSAWSGGTAFGHTFPGVAGTSGIGDTLLCTRSIDTLDKVMGGFWSDIAKTSTGAKRSSLDQARMQLLQQMLAAELNASAFGSVPGVGTFAAWEAAYCGTNVNAIKTAQQQAASFNSAGDSGQFTPGTSANSKQARAIANYVFWNTLP